jgi:hypothetical protein
MDNWDVGDSTRETAWCTTCEEVGEMVHAQLTESVWHTAQRHSWYAISESTWISLQAAIWDSIDNQRKYK